MIKDQLYCGKCGFTIPLLKKYIQPHYRKESGLILTKPILCCYILTCPVPDCKRKTEYSKDYARDVFIQHNQEKLMAVKL